MRLALFFFFVWKRIQFHIPGYDLMTMINKLLNGETMKVGWRGSGIKVFNVRINIDGTITAKVEPFVSLLSSMS